MTRERHTYTHSISGEWTVVYLLPKLNFNTNTYTRAGARAGSNLISFFSAQHKIIVFTQLTMKWCGVPSSSIPLCFYSLRVYRSTLAFAGIGGPVCTYVPHSWVCERVCSTVRSLCALFASVCVYVVKSLRWFYYYFCFHFTFLLSSRLVHAATTTTTTVVAAANVHTHTERERAIIHRQHTRLPVKHQSVVFWSRK